MCSELTEILLTEEMWTKKLGYAEMNPTTTQVELNEVRQQVERIREHPAICCICPQIQRFSVGSLYWNSSDESLCDMKRFVT